MGLTDPNDPDHDVKVFVFEFVVVYTVGISRCAEDPDAGCNDADH